jgi:hypothetical protein
VASWSENRIRRNALGEKRPPDWGGKETDRRLMIYDAVGREPKDIPSTNESLSADA